MNILPKKSWHVRTKKNIERVRKDEEKAAEEEKEKQRRVALAEQESRTEALRDRARKRGHDEIEAPSLLAVAEVSQAAGSSSVAKVKKDISLSQGGHINFFKDIEQGLVREGKNKEHEADKAAEKEKWEKDIGLLTYLGQSAVETQNERPWYLQKSEKSAPEKKVNPYEVKVAGRNNRDRKLKDSMDPLLEMKRHFEKSHKLKHQHKDKERHHKHKSSKRDTAKTTTSSKTSPSTSSVPAQSKSSKTIEQLRAERLRREAGEKQKIAEVMMRERGETVTQDADEFVTDADKDRSRGYNSRYNPNFVKNLSNRKR
ncbi:leukocyte receptor cluster member 1 homolog [Littorina saxatilis]|uniref:CBF1-interacting co-repressor CIR N-terminal domain-containing protein n=1 Tax=Littorina saxatilis TaxID=31220 RepID=A0AAN9AHW3_9CAEN